MAARRADRSARPQAGHERGLQGSTKGLIHAAEVWPTW